PMKITIIGGGSGMLSNSIGTVLKKVGYFIQVIGKSSPVAFAPDVFIRKNLLEDAVYITELLDSDVIIYAAGAGVQAAVPIAANTMYTMNLLVPIKLCLLLNEHNYLGTFVSFGTYMEIGCNDEMYKSFNEDELLHSCLPVTNDYVLSKRLFTHYIHNANFVFRKYHFVLPNLFSRDEVGTRLLPYVVNYLRERKKCNKVEQPRFSSGSQIRQYVFIEEVIEAIFKCIEGEVVSGIYNIGGGQTATIREFIEELFNAFCVDVDEHMFGKELRRDNDILSLSLNDAKLYKAIHYSPIIKITDIYHE
ncbi:NAD-dependent epimerase/dehydratase family protein, partial [Bacteroides fragilis]